MRACWGSGDGFEALLGAAAGGKSGGGRRASLRCGGRPAQRADCAALRGLVARRGTRCVRCARFAQTTATSQITKRAARAATNPALLATAQALRPPPAPGFANAALGWGRKETGAWRASSPPSAGQVAGSMPATCLLLPQRTVLSCKAVGGCVWVRVCGGEQRRVRGGARSAPRDLTRRGCSSAANAVRAASSATRPEPEQRSAVGPKGRPPQPHAHRHPSTALPQPVPCIRRRPSP
jgi:hypothetical protein